MEETLYGVVVLLFLAGTCVTVWLRLRSLEAANRALVQRAERAERELHQVLQTLSAPERQRLAHERNRSRPMPHPPSGLESTANRLRQHTPDPLAFALGWEVTRETPDVAFLSMTNSSEFHAGNIAITGEPGHGKGSLAMLILLQLARATTTSQLRIQIIDPKVSDGALWESRAHLWRAPVLGDDLVAIQTMLDALREERQRRDQLRAKHKVREWEELPPEVRPPFLVVWITELAKVARAVDRADEWLEGELSQCRAAGIRYLIDLQNQSGKEMAWRSQIGTFVAGFQSSAHHIRPNIGLTAEEITELGGVLPTSLKLGQFTVRNKRDVVSVTVPHLTTEAIRTALAALPEAPLVSTTPVAAVVEVEERRSAPADELPIAPELWTRIAAVARDLQLKDPANATRAEVYRLVFAGGDPKARPSGDNYKRVRRVCDAEGLLLPKAPMSTSNPAVALSEMVNTA
ncbi:MAG TPA: FtsK/SpoIIIE domain-containing protein [Roseiflexaceae bacterium]|nr:FtsK/SpoIIIE domain-containing protein [Roseiflexaceae bacterium]